MCGRIFQIHNIGQLLQYTRAAKIRNAASFNPTYNQGPTNYIAAIREYNDDDANWKDADEKVVPAVESQIKEQADYIQEEIEKETENKPKRGLDFMKWGYQTKFNMILNARIEEMHEKHTYKKLLNTRRCVVIADGYYEWDSKKQPFKYENVNQKPLLMAAMYSDDDEVFVLTRDSFGDFQKVHHRMPVLLEENEIDLWIDCKNNYYDIVDNRILNQQKKIWTSVQSVMVCPAVNSMKEKSEKCIMTMEEYKATQFNKGLGRYFQKKPAPKPELEAQLTQVPKPDYDKIEEAAPEDANQEQVEGVDVLEGLEPPPIIEEDEETKRLRLEKEELERKEREEREELERKEREEKAEQERIAKEEFEAKLKEDTIKFNEMVLQGISGLAKTATSYAYVKLNLAEKDIDRLFQINYLQLRYLDISQNRLVDISNVLPLKFLVQLNASKNEINTLNYFTDDQAFPYLQYLNLANNKIASLIAIQLPRLRRLNLIENEISSLTFEGHANIETLELGKNKLKNTDGLSNMPNLKYLYLQGNEINDFRSLQNLPKLEKLNIRANKITKVKTPVIELPSLYYLNLRENQLAKFDDLKKLAKIRTIKVLNMLANPIADEMGEGFKQEILMFYFHFIRINKSDVTKEDLDEAQRVLQERRDEEERKRIEEEAQREEARLLEEARLAEEAKIAEETRLIEEARLAEEAKIAEEARIAEETRIAEENRILEEQRQAEEQRIADEAKLAAQEQQE